MQYEVGIDLGGSSVKAVSVGAENGEERKVHQEANVAFDSMLEMDWAQTIVEILRTIERRRGARAAYVGLSAPGLAAADGRSIAYMPGRLQGLEGLDWTRHLERDVMVRVLNDAHAALVGERALGAARGLDHVILFTLGTGVGGAAMVDGRLLRGQMGRAGHLGHMSLDPEGSPDVTGAPGSLEDAIGNCTIRTRSGGRFDTTHDLIRAVECGDLEAAAVWLRAVKALAAAIASAINVLDPQAVIVGGGIARAGGTLFAPLERFLETMEWRPGGQRARVLPAALGEFAGAIGAAHSQHLL